MEAFILLNARWLTSKLLKGQLQKGLLGRTTASVSQKESDLHFSIPCSKHMKTEKSREKELGKKWTHSCLRSVKEIVNDLGQERMRQKRNLRVGAGIREFPLSFNRF